MGAFASQRIFRTATITLNAPLDQVFPLFGPIREKEWAEGWQPEIVYSTTGLVEEHMVLRTPGHHGGQEPDYVWVVSLYRPELAFIEYTVFAAERLWWISIQCRAGAGQTTQAEISYTYTGLSEAGNAINAWALQAMYAHDLKDWEAAINHYLRTGERMRHP